MQLTLSMQHNLVTVIYYFVVHALQGYAFGRFVLYVKKKTSFTNYKLQNPSAAYYQIYMPSKMLAGPSESWIEH